MGPCAIFVPREGAGRSIGSMLSCEHKASFMATAVTMFRTKKTNIPISGNEGSDKTGKAKD
jgi:hypothetical protein